MFYRTNKSTNVFCNTKISSILVPTSPKSLYINSLLIFTPLVYIVNRTGNILNTLLCIFTPGNGCVFHFVFVLCYFVSDLTTRGNLGRDIEYGKINDNILHHLSCNLHFNSKSSGFLSVKYSLVRTVIWD